MKKITLNCSNEAKTLVYPQGIRSGAGDRSYLAPFLSDILIHFNKFMLEYQDQEFEEGL